jgi:putative DNA primase/helicase
MTTKEEMRKAMRLPCAVCGAVPEKRTGFPELCDTCSIAKLGAIIDKINDSDSTYQCLSDIGNAKRLVMRHGKEYRHAAERGWMRWTGCRWEEDKLLAVVEDAKDTVEKIRGEVSLIRKMINETEDEKKERQEAQKAVVAWAKTSESRRSIDAMIHLAKSDPAISCTIDNFDARLNLFNFQNGTYDFDKMEFHPHQREDMLTHMSEMNYEAGRECPEFKKFVLDVQGGNQAMADYLQRCAGYTMSANVGEHDLFIPWGPGGTGKGTFIRVMQGIMGDYCATPDAEMFMAKRGDAGQPFDLARLAGVRALFAEETEENKRLAVGKLKKLTGGGRISACFKGCDHFEYPIIYKVWLATNSLPRVPASDDAVWQRVKPIPFNVRYRDTELEIKDYADKLLEKEGSGILNWMIDGYAMWKKEGLAAPIEVVEAAKDWQDGEDWLQRFLDECTDASSNTKTYASASTMWKAFQYWVGDNKECRVVTSRVFNDGMEKKGFKQSPRNVNGRSVKLWIGLAVRLTADSFRADVIEPSDFGFSQ